MDRENLTRVIQARLAEVSSVVAVWLFGSVARGTATARSDVDIGILSTRIPSTVDVLDLQADMTSVLGVDVQIVVLETAPVDLIHRVLRDGQLLIERDRSARIRFEVDARNRYFDMRPILLEYRRGRGAA